MQTIEKEITRNDISRKVSETYTLGSYRVHITTKHDKTRKAFITSVSECQVMQRDGYAMEFHSVFTDYFKNIKAEKVARYSFAALNKFHDSAAGEAAEIVSQLFDNYKSREAAEI